MEETGVLRESRLKRMSKQLEGWSTSPSSKSSSNLSADVEGRTLSSPLRRPPDVGGACTPPPQRPSPVGVGGASPLRRRPMGGSPSGSPAQSKRRSMLVAGGPTQPTRPVVAPPKPPAASPALPGRTSSMMALQPPRLYRCNSAESPRDEEEDGAGRPAVAAPVPLRKPPPPVKQGSVTVVQSSILHDREKTSSNLESFMRKRPEADTIAKKLHIDQETVEEVSIINQKKNISAGLDGFLQFRPARDAVARRHVFNRGDTDVVDDSIVQQKAAIAVTLEGFLLRPRPTVGEGEPDQGVQVPATKDAVDEVAARKEKEEETDKKEEEKKEEPTDKKEDSKKKDKKDKVLKKDPTMTRMQRLFGVKRTTSQKKLVVEPETNQVFGSSLEDMKTNGLCDDRGVPNLVNECIRILKGEEAIKTVGLFRISAPAGEFNMVSENLAAGGALDPETDFHIVACILKKFVRDLPQPLLTFKYCLAYLSALDYSNRTQQVEMLRDTFLKMPLQYQVVTAKLLAFLNSVSTYEKTNLMGTSNLGVVFGPNLLREERPDPNFYAQYGTRLSEVIALMIEAWMEICVSPELDHILSDLLFNRPLGVGEGAGAHAGPKGRRVQSMMLCSTPNSGDGGASRSVRDMSKLMAAAQPGHGIMSELQTSLQKRVARPPPSRGPPAPAAAHSPAPAPQRPPPKVTPPMMRSAPQQAPPSPAALRATQSPQPPPGNTPPRAKPMPPPVRGKAGPPPSAPPPQT